ncbi:MAG: HugZ family protein [Thiotrichales bacterium]
MAEKPSPEALQTEAQAFRAGFKTVLLATSGPDGAPEASYSPFVLDDAEDILLFVSDLAQHTRNLRANPRASLMFIANESDTTNLFARQRLILACSAEFIPRDPADWPVRLALFEQKFGKMMGLLKSLPDFHLVRLRVDYGNYVRGFAQAYALAGKALEVQHLRRG